MTEKPIIFSTPMVRAILAGEKTQTRRVVVPQPSVMIYNDGANRWYPSGVWGGKDWHAKYEAGDLLWVREKHTFVADHFAIRAGVAYADDSILWLDGDAQEMNGKTVYNVEAKGKWKWRPSIFMPRWASRITLRVTSVWPQRLQGISEDDCLAEGIESTELFESYASLASAIGLMKAEPLPRRAFSELWDDINAKRGYSWDSNPWVWAYKFEVMQS